METKKYYELKPNTKVEGSLVSHMHITRKSKPRNTDTEQHYDGSFYLVDIKQWLPFGHMPTSYLEGLIK